METREGGRSDVQRRMGRSGTSLLIARAASSPSITGMQRSRMRMSGASCRILRIASPPLGASAQTHPLCSSINLRSPDLKITLSSAMRTRVNKSSPQINCHSSCPRSIGAIGATGLVNSRTLTRWELSKYTNLRRTHPTVFPCIAGRASPQTNKVF